MRLLKNLIIVDPFFKMNKTIILSEDIKSRPDVAKVLIIGEEVTKIVVGDIVHYSPHAGLPYLLDIEPFKDVKTYLMSENDIFIIE